MKLLLEIFFYIWQLPQNLLGLIFLLFYTDEKCFCKVDGRRFYYTPKMPSGISLGNYIILNHEDTKEMFYHEYGHSVDSRIWGPLYLLVIGLPSALGNLYSRKYYRTWKYSDYCEWYYNQPWEKSADRKGGVDRKTFIEILRKGGN